MKESSEAIKKEKPSGIIPKWALEEIQSSPTLGWIVVGIILLSSVEGVLDSAHSVIQATTSLIKLIASLL